MTVEKTQALDWSTCPLCGATDEFGVLSEERIYGSNTLGLVVAGGRLVGASWGLTEPDYSSSVTRGYYTECCHEELPEAYQDALDDALQNCRDPEA